jgi:hypothetical protein
VILVVASRVDDEARALADEFPGSEALVLTCRDLSRPGWRVASSGPTAAVVGDHLLTAGAVRGVVTLLPCVFARELVHIIDSERDYVAAEMNAFLLFWLSGLACPVLNRPSPGCLSGPNWRTEQWLRVALQVGIPTIGCRRATRAAPTTEQEAHWRSVTLVGDEVIGTDDNILQRHTRALASAANVDMLATAFLWHGEAPRLAAAHTFPDMSSPDVRRAVVRYFERRA